MIAIYKFFKENYNYFNFAENYYTFCASPLTLINHRFEEGPEMNSTYGAY